MTSHRLAVAAGFACLIGAAAGQEPPKALPTVPPTVPPAGQPKEMPPVTGKPREPAPATGRTPDEPPPPPIRPALPGDIVDRIYMGSYIHGTSTLHGGVTYEGPFPNGLFRTPNFHFGGFYAPAPYWPALSLPDYYYPGWGIHSQYFGYTPYTYGLWNLNPIPSPLAGGAIYPDTSTIKPGQLIPVPSPHDAGPRGPMPPPDTIPQPRQPGMGSVPGQVIPSAPAGPVQVTPTGRRR